MHFQVRIYSQRGLRSLIVCSNSSITYSGLLCDFPQKLAETALFRCFVSSKRKYLVGLCVRYVTIIYSLLIYGMQHVMIRDINRSTFNQ